MDKLSPGSRATLQAMIGRCVRANNAAFEANAALSEWCRDRYGFEPGDRDVDAVLDAVMGAAGIADGLTADDFDQAMREAK